MIATLLLSAAFAAQPAVFEPVQLKVNAGDKFVYTSESKTDANSDSGQGSFSATVKSRSSVEFTGSAEGWFHAKETILEYSNDSNSPGADMMGDPKGMVATYDVSPFRKIKDWKVAEPGNLTSDQADAFQANGAGEAKAGMDSLIFPEDGITEGSTWEFEHEPGNGGMPGMKSTTTGKVKTAYTAGSFSGTGSDRTLTINAKTTGSFTVDIDSPNGQFSIDVDVDMKSTYTVRAKDGIVTKFVADGTRHMSTQFGEFSLNVKTTTELVKS